MLRVRSSAATVTTGVLKVWSVAVGIPLPVLQPATAAAATAAAGSTGTLVARRNHSFLRTALMGDTTRTTVSPAGVIQNRSHPCYFSSSNNDNDGAKAGKVSEKKPKVTTKPRRSVDDIVAKETYHPSSHFDDDSTLDPRFTKPEDPFGLLFDDGPNKLGPILPPIYERDSITGRLITTETDNVVDANMDPNTTAATTTTTTTTTVVTMKQQQQLTDHDKQILSMDSMERDMKLLESIKKHWQDPNSGTGTGTANRDDTGTTTTTANATTALTEMGERIRTTDVATNVLGRSVHGQRTKEILEDGTEMISRDTEYNFSQPLTLEEYNAFEQYMKTKHDMDITVDDIPVSTRQKPNPVGSSRTEEEQQRRMAYPKMDETPTASAVHPDEAELSLKWLTSRAQRQMDDTLDDNPFSDLMPGDLSPQRIVNRKHAKIIPTKLLHYNHMSLLQHFIGPTGQIMNRSQTRLGARDQRRISKLIKRSRALGLIPYIGQFKIENHGWTHTKDIHTKRKWENQIEQRGLVIQPSSSSSSSQSPHPPQRQLSSNNKSTTTSRTPSTTSSTTALGALPDGF